jgi:hypothetical protein
VKPCSFTTTLVLVGIVLAGARAGTEAGSVTPNASPAPASGASPWPLQLEMRVPFQPTAFPSADGTYLTYELYLTNFTANPITLRRIEVLNADKSATAPVAVFEAGQLDALLQPIGAHASADSSGNLCQLAGGGSVVVFVWIKLDHGAHVPNSLRHRVLTADSSVEGAIIATHHTKLLVLRSPVQGAHWLASDGPSNDQDNHHRRGILVLDGRALISRRYAIDWQQIEGGTTFSGDARDRHSYYSYGKDVFAVADGTVVAAKDGLPDNVPGHNENFHPAVPQTMDTVAGNTITLDLGRGQFAYYAHLQPGSLRVKAKDRVRRGQVLARIGSSGDAREPHLHFEVTTSPKLMVGQGVPYLIDQYRVKSADDASQTRIRELPLGGMLIDFGQRHGNLN